MLFLIYEQYRLHVLGKVPNTLMFSRGTSNYSHRGLRRKGFEKESSFPSFTGTLQILPGPESRHVPFDFYSYKVLKARKSFPNKLAWSLIFTCCLSAKELSIKTNGFVCSPWNNLWQQLCFLFCPFGISCFVYHLGNIRCLARKHH